jgi:hypothetical protein
VGVVYRQALAVEGKKDIDDVVGELKCGLGVVVLPEHSRKRQCTRWKIGE